MPSENEAMQQGNQEEYGGVTFDYLDDEGKEEEKGVNEEGKEEEEGVNEEGKEEEVEGNEEGKEEEQGWNEDVVEGGG